MLLSSVVVSVNSDSFAIRQVKNRNDAEMVINLIQQFVEWLRERYPDKLSDVATYFYGENLDAQLDSLLNEGESSERQVLLATVGDSAVGTVMLVRIDDATCQMNRLFVADAFKGMQIGRRLCEHLIKLATSLGYSVMRLHTTSRQYESRNLYLSLGFQPCDSFGTGGEMAEYYEMILG